MSSDPAGSSEAAQSRQPSQTQPLQQQQSQERQSMQSQQSQQASQAAAAGRAEQRSSGAGQAEAPITVTPPQRTTTTPVSAPSQLPTVLHFHEAFLQRQAKLGRLHKHYRTQLNTLTGELRDVHEQYQQVEQVLATGGAAARRLHMRSNASPAVSRSGRSSRRRGSGSAPSSPATQSPAMHGQHVPASPYSQGVASPYHSGYSPRAGESMYAPRTGRQEYDVETERLTKAQLLALMRKNSKGIVRASSMYMYRKRKQGADKKRKHSPGGGHHILKFCAAKLPGELRCTNASMLGCDYCRIHILHDPNQKLYKPCEFKHEDGSCCGHPTFRAVFPPFCVFHLPQDYVPPLLDLPAVEPPSSLK